MSNQQLCHLFAGFPQVMVRACLEGSMGDVLVDRPDHPQSALARVGKQAWFGFLAGQPNLDLIETCRGLDIILVPEHEGWSQLIVANYGSAAQTFERYAMELIKSVDTRYLTDLVQHLPHGFTIKPIDETLYQLCLSESWSQDLVANYDDFAHYQAVGLGMAILDGEKVVAGASSFASSRKAIEIEVDTHPAYRRRGLARVASASLLRACLKRGIEPSWDAHNLASLKLAEQLGYQLTKTYKAHEINW